MSTYRNLSKHTTNEEILAPIATAKAELHAFVTEQLDSEYLEGERMVRLAQNVMNAEAVANVAMTYANILRSEATVERRTEYLLSILTRGADDSWSGRGNDAKRSAFDAVREFCSNEFDNIRYAD